MVAIDAMGCQTKIAKAIRDQAADYLLALKDKMKYGAGLWSGSSRH